jgi:hypothetical protein
MAKAKERVNKRNIFQLQERLRNFFPMNADCSAATTRSSLRSLTKRVENYRANLERNAPLECETLSTVIAREAKQSIATSCAERWIASLRAQ